MRANERRSGLQPAKRMLQVAVSDRGGSDYKRAVGDRAGNSLILLGVGQHFRGADGGTSTLKRYIVRIYDPQMLKTKVAHCPSGCADIERIARIYQNHAQVIEFRRRGQAAFILRQLLLSFVPAHSTLAAESNV